MLTLRCVIFSVLLLLISQESPGSQSILQKILEQWRGYESRISLSERALVSRFNTTWRARIAEELGESLSAARTLEDLYALRPRAQKRLTQLIEAEAYPGLKVRTFELRYSVPAQQRESYELLLRQFDESALGNLEMSHQLHELAKAEAEIRSLSDIPFLSTGCKNISDPVAYQQLTRVTYRVKSQLRASEELSSEQMSEILLNSFHKVFKGNKADLWKQRICPLVRICKIIDQRWAKACFTN